MRKYSASLGKYTHAGKLYATRENILSIYAGRPTFPWPSHFKELMVRGSVARITTLSSARNKQRDY
jgi:hypothetical protein